MSAPQHVMDRDALTPFLNSSSWNQQKSACFGTHFGRHMKAVFANCTVSDDNLAIASLWTRVFVYSHGTPCLVLSGCSVLKCIGPWHAAWACFLLSQASRCSQMWDLRRKTTGKVQKRLVGTTWKLPLAFLEMDANVVWRQKNKQCNNNKNLLAHLWEVPRKKKVTDACHHN